MKWVGDENVEIGDSRSDRDVFCGICGMWISGSEWDIWVSDIPRSSSHMGFDSVGDDLRSRSYFWCSFQSRRHHYFCHSPTFPILAGHFSSYIFTI